MDKSQLIADFIEEVQHGVHGSAEAAAEDAGDEALAGFEVKGIGIDVAGFFESSVDGDGEGLKGFDFVQVVVGFGFIDLVLLADHEDADG